MKTPRQAVYSKDKLMCTFVEYTNLKKTLNLKKLQFQKQFQHFQV